MFSIAASFVGGGAREVAAGNRGGKTRAFLAETGSTARPELSELAEYSSRYEKVEHPLLLLLTLPLVLSDLCFLGVFPLLPKRRG